MLGTCGGILEAFQMLGGKIGGVEGGMRRGGGEWSVSQGQ